MRKWYSKGKEDLYTPLLLTTESMCSVKIILLKLAKLNSAAIFIQLLHEKENTAEEFCVCVCVCVCFYLLFRHQDANQLTPSPTLCILSLQFQVLEMSSRKSSTQLEYIVDKMGFRGCLTWCLGKSPGDWEGQGHLECCSPGGNKESWKRRNLEGESWKPSDFKSLCKFQGDVFYPMLLP